jgi:HEAT repeat protein
VVPLIHILGSESGPERTAAIKAISGIGQAAVRDAVEALNHEGSRVREGAALVLGEIHSPEATEPLVGAFADPNPAVQAAAAFALGESRHPLALECLIRGLEKSSDHLRQRIFHALGRTGDPAAVAALAGFIHAGRLDAQSQTIAVEALRQLPCGEYVANSLNSGNEHLRDWALIASQQLKDPNRIDLFAVALRDQDPALREKAADILGELKDTRALSMLLSAMNDSEEPVCSAAARALVNMGSLDAVGPLIRVLQTENTGARRWAAVALGEFADSRAAEPLRQALRDVDAGVRKYAAKALARTAGASAVESLNGLLSDGEPAVRQAAVYALGSIDDAKATTVLESALGNKDLPVRTAATKAWRRKAGPSGFPALLESLNARAGERPVAAAETLEVLLRRNAAALAIDSLKAVEHLPDRMTVEARSTIAGIQKPLEVDCREIKLIAYGELLRRGARTVTRDNMTTSA